MHKMPRAAQHQHPRLAVPRPGNISPNYADVAPLFPRSYGCLMTLFILGGTGNSGQRLVRIALDRSYHVTAFVRDIEKLVSKLGGLRQTA